MKIPVCILCMFLIFSCKNEQKKPDSVKSPADSLAITSVSDIDVKKILTGKREWQLLGIEPWLGSACKEGERLTFQDKSVIHSQCIGGKWETETIPWTLSKDNDDWKLNVGNVAYFVIFKNDTLVLRLMDGAKDHTTLDKKFLAEGE